MFYSLYPGCGVSLKVLKVCLYSKKERLYKWVDFEAIKSNKIRVYVNNNWKVELLLKEVLNEKDIMSVVLPNVNG